MTNYEKLRNAREALKRIIETINSKETWNPEVEAVTSNIVVIAENTLRDIEEELPPPPLEQAILNYIEMED